MNGIFTPHDGGACPCDPNTWVEPQFRGPEDPAKGCRRAFGFAHQFDWQHDGVDDDVVGWRAVRW